MIFLTVIIKRWQNFNCCKCHKNQKSNKFQIIVNSSYVRTNQKKATLHSKKVEHSAQEEERSAKALTICSAKAQALAQKTSLLSAPVRRIPVQPKEQLVEQNWSQQPLVAVDPQMDLAPHAVETWKTAKTVVARVEVLGRWNCPPRHLHLKECCNNDLRSIKN